MSAAGQNEVKPVEERHRIDEAALHAWMLEQVDAYQAPLTLSQFKGGQSNPTYRIDTPNKSYVLRRKPFGELLPSAHAVDREFRVCSALFAAGFPVARPYALCTDPSVIGADFYVMDFVAGRVFWNGALPELRAEERRNVYHALCTTLADLHAFNPEEIGLADYGKPGNYIARQIERWSKQYRMVPGDQIDAFERLMDFLPQSVPEQTHVSIVHGDYRLDNVMLHATEPRAAAVLDWELSTLGDPIADFSYFLMIWAIPADGGSSLGGLDLKALGVPTLEEIAALYCQKTGRDTLPSLDWLFAYNLFRLAAIFHGIGGRVRDGTAASEKAKTYAARARPFAERAWEYAKKAGA